MRESITIHKFIYHILITKDEKVDYLSAVSLSDKHKSFFQEMISESSRGTKYLFVDEEKATLKGQCKELVDNLDDNDLFVQTSEQIAHNFKAQHDKRMADGIVIVTTFSMIVNAQAQNFVAIMKLDYKPVLHQIRDEKDPSKVTFEEITDTLLEEKAAIQKRAIIDVGQSFEWDVIAVERGKANSKQDTDVAIGDHFKKFLSVTLKEDNSVMTRKIISHSKRWAEKHQELVPSDVRARVIKYIEAHEEQAINVDDIKELICNHESDDTKRRLKVSFDDYMDDVELSGVQFTSKPNSIPAMEKKTKIKTNMNVKLEWEGEMKEAGIERKKVAGKIVYTVTADSVNDIS
ncbi:hypothetical protein GCHA_4307 [Paraglaciecola chathamensis S18K6]|uniref:Uncharacterized protein n=2 Tax=Paraglaciecola chathamensis TaxID=368405 RepID=A0AAV3V762_9ALTE|nr:hypothetical protein GCHA_4307 [Paraglaciecola chathamensis S18K6]